MNIEFLRDRLKQKGLENIELLTFKDEKEWLEIRKTGIGGSDVGTILGVNKYKNDYTLFQEKLGRKIPDDLSENEAVNRGKKAEKHLLELCNIYNPSKKFFSPEVTFKRKDKPWMIANLDGISEDLTEGLEIKTACVNDFSEWRNKIPDTYYCQIMHYMAVTGLKKFTLFALIELRNFNSTTPKRQLIEHTIVRSEKDIELIEKRVEEFWNKIQKKEWNKFNLKINI
ncbi:MAG: lambda-exonuclease family protein [Cetobacterium sp.]|uniref:lambda-exonuclease family protein n=1 Tax=Cetobacterium sp. TaxID=2071632 RepID=UPI003EE69DBC